VLRRLVFSLAATLGASCAGLVMAASAFAAPADVAATHSYIKANYAYARASVARIHAAHAKIAVFEARLARECPNVGKGSPENDASQPMSYEVAVALWSLAYGVDAGPIRTFARATGSLRWSNPRLTRLARGYASDLQKLASLQMPDLCADVTEWRESGYRTMPPRTIQLTERVEAIQPQTIPARLLAPYASAADRRTLVLTARLERKLKDNETVVGWDEWEGALNTLGLRL
jgi:hypothetical protein